MNIDEWINLGILSLEVKDILLILMINKILDLVTK